MIPQSVKVPICLYKHFLHNIFRIMGITELAISQSKDGLLMFTHEPCESLARILRDRFHKDARFRFLSVSVRRVDRTSHTIIVADGTKSKKNSDTDGN